jgi:putative Ca2+/H+ antiporter (TMEM165/GDT1 family)
MLPALVATFGAVLVSEIAGDKLLYIMGILGARYRAAPVVCGMAMAFAAKMAAAVLAGHAIGQLPPVAIAVVTAANFLAIASALWRSPVHAAALPEPGVSRAVLVTFAAIFFSEWGDAGQLTAATMAARFGSPLAVWAGAVAAMCTKSALAAWAGAGGRPWLEARVSPRLLRNAAAAVLLLLGLLSAAETLGAAS